MLHRISICSLLLSGYLLTHFRLHFDLLQFCVIFTVNQLSAAGETLHTHRFYSDSQNPVIKCLLMGSSADRSQLIATMLDEGVAAACSEQLSFLY